MKKIRLIEIPSDLGAYKLGASLGVDAIKIAALESKSDVFSTLQVKKIPDLNNLLLEPFGSKYARHIDGIRKMYNRISRQIKTTIENNELPLVLSGDHSSAGAVISGIKMARAKQKLGVIWIDAHGDIHSPYTTPSGKLHGMPLAIVLGEDNLAMGTNRPSKETIKAWNQLKNIGGFSPKIEYSDLVYVGLRDIEKQEAAVLKEHKVRNFKVSELRKIGPLKVAREVLKHLEQCKYIYISFDVDVLDPSVSVGTGTIAKGGLKEAEAEKLFTALCKSRKVCCIELTEVNPAFDTNNSMAKVAFRLLDKMLKSLNSKK